MAAITTKPVMCVMAGSSDPADPLIKHIAEILGQRIGAEGYDIIYGGGTSGVMGCVATSARDAGANVRAITLEKYSHEPQIVGANISVVTTEAERFAAFAATENLAAFIALPGGPGSIREVMQALELAVYENGAPVILAQTADYLDGIEHYFQRALEAGMIKPEKANCLRTWNPHLTLVQIINAAPQAAKPTPPAIA